MEKLKTITLGALCMLLTLGIITFYSCDKGNEPSRGEAIELMIHNPNNFEVRMEIEGMLNCDPDENPNYDSFGFATLYPPPAHMVCIAPKKDDLWHQLNLGPGNMQVETRNGFKKTKKIKIRAYNYKDKDTRGGEEVGEVSFKGKFGKKYKWTVGYGNSVEEVVPPPPSSGGGSGSGSGGSGNCPGAEAQRYKDLLTNSPSNSCSQIWAQQAVWHAYKCNCDRGMASASDANQMVATLNATRTAIENLYKSGGSGPYTKCGAIPPKVTKCKVQ